MKIASYLFVAGVLFFASCSTSPKEEALKKIMEMDKNDSTIENPDKLAELNQLYQQFISQYPEDPNCREFTYKAAESSNMLGQFEDAIRLYDIFFTRYPEDKRAGLAMFMKGFILENGLNKIGPATDVYNEVIKKYPNTDAARDAAQSIKLIGYSDQELIHYLDSLNPESDSIQ
jgi:TolA-binding protein